MTTAILFIVGLALLILGAEVLVRGAARLALSLGIPPLLVGLTVIAYATGSPELAVSVQAARLGQSDIALGNVVGSNIFNILFILGISATILPLVVSRRLVRLEVPLMFGVSALLYIMARDAQLSITEGAVLFAGSVAYTLFIVFQAIQEGKKSPNTVTKEERDEEDFAEDRADAGRRNVLLDVTLIAVGLVMLVLGARWLVAGAVAFAQYLGISEAVIALTIIAGGTGLPEVATSVVAGLRGQRDIAVGNVVGSNIFNILAVLGIAALASKGGTGLTIPASIISFDLLIMTATALACLPIVLNGYEVKRWEGMLFLGYYVAYTTFLVLKETEHVALPLFRTAMLGFFMPLTAITLGILWWRAFRRGAKGV